ncbi:MAG: beta-lactamase family protein, partial [Flavobacteriaceae bacterium]|nr:beta-lactamase family protein [Flavobacteriaceae bacterium]
MKKIISFLTFPFISMSVVAQQNEAKMENQILSQEIENKKSPSVQYYFFNEDQIIETFQSGFADIANQKTADENITYNAFSVTKTFTALAVLQLAEQGKIDLDNPVIHYLPDFSYGSEITVKQILNHTSGIPNPIPLSWIHLAEEHSSFNRNNFFATVFKKKNNLKSKSGEKFSYSNLGYVVLGQLIEKISGTTYEDYVSEHILQKLSLNSDDLSFTINNGETHAKGYHKRLSLTNLLLGFFIDKSKFMGKSEGKWRPFKNFYVNGASYGGLIGKPKSFVKYIQELLKDDCIL